MKLFDANGAWLSAAEAESLAALGWEVVEPEKHLGECPVPESGIDAVLIDGRFPLRDIEKYTALRLVVLTSAGFDGLQTDYLKERGIRLYNARGIFSAPIAEFVLMGVLELCKKAGAFAAQQKSRVWKRRFDLGELVGKTVCVVGTGSIGMECARRFRAMDSRVIGVSRSGRGGEHFDEAYTLADLDRALSRSDVVVLALPLNPESEGLFDEGRFAAMKEGSIIVNVARGPIVREAGLIAALRSGRLGGAVLDVFEKEPLDAESELWDMENVIVTPHNSFCGDGTRARLGERVLKILAADGEGFDEAI